MTIIDTTEAVGPLPVGYIEPAEQILSDEEARPMRSNLPRGYADRQLSRKIFTPRIYKDAKNGKWVCDDDLRLTPRFWDDSLGARISWKNHDTFAEALTTFREQDAIDAAKRHIVEVKAGLYRGVAL